jgi:hypothetical protein
MKLRNTLMAQAGMVALVLATKAGIAQENGLTPEQLQQAVESQGMPYAIYRDRIRGEI